MQNMDTDVGDLLVQYESLPVKHQILAELFALIQRFHNAGFYHGDISLSNIMAVAQNKSEATYNARKYKYYLIDFEYAGRSTEKSKEFKGDWRQLLGSIYDLSRDFYSDAFSNIYEVTQPLI